MRVLLIGATGYVGAVVLERLVERGHQVLAVVRGTEGRLDRVPRSPAVEQVEGDASDPAAVGDLVRSWGADAAVHAGAVGDWELDRRLVEALASALRRQGRRGVRGPSPLVYTSGVWVLGTTHGGPADEGSGTDPIPIVDGRETVESAVLAADDVRGVVIRPGIVHGRAGGIPEILVRWAHEDGAGRYVGASEPGPVTWPMVHVDDLADLFALAIEDPRAQGILHGVAEPAVRVAALAEAAAAAAGVTREAHPWELTAASEQLGLPFAQALALTQRVEAPAAHALGWTPSRPRAVEELLARSLQSHQRQSPVLSASNADARDTRTTPAELRDDVA